jgi:hypothetical protein
VTSLVTRFFAKRALGKKGKGEPKEELRSAQESAEAKPDGVADLERKTP